MAQFFKTYGLITLFLGTVALVAGVSVVWPLLSFNWPTEETASAAKAIRWSRLEHTIMGSLTNAAVAIWVFFLGSCVGSFLNVVVYRVPLGQSVASHASYCPKCGEGIRPSDNIPVIGWLRLKGECRSCQLPISCRYPIVEFTIGLLFLYLYFVQLTTAGANIPVESFGFRTGVVANLLQPNWPLIGLTLYHSFLFCAVFSWAMILRDGLSVPIRSVAMTFAIGAVPAICFPMLLPVQQLTVEEAGALLSNSIPTFLDSHFASAVTVLAGAAVGAIAATVTGLIASKVRFAVNAFHIPSWMLAGICLGWQAVVATFVLNLVWLIVASIPVLLTKKDPKPEPKPADDLTPLIEFDSPPPDPPVTERQMAMVGIYLAVFFSLAIHHGLWKMIWTRLWA